MELEAETPRRGQYLALAAQAALVEVRAVRAADLMDLMALALKAVRGKGQQLGNLEKVPAICMLAVVLAVVLVLVVLAVVVPITLREAPTPAAAEVASRGMLIQALALVVPESQSSAMQGGLRNGKINGTY